MLARGKGVAVTWWYSDVLDRLDRIERLVRRILKEEKIMAGELEALRAQVAKTTEVDESAVLLIQGLAAKIEAIKTDPVALQEFANSLKSESDRLAEAVVANTPAG